MSLKISKYFRLIDFIDREKAVTTQHVLHESRKNLMGHEIPMKAFFDHHRLHGQRPFHKKTKKMLN